MTPKEAVEWLESAYGRGGAPKIDRAIAVLRTFVDTNTPWLPPQQEGFGPWIEYRVGDPGPRVTDAVQVLYERDRARRLWDGERSASEFPWHRTHDPIVAYCVKLREAE